MTEILIAHISHNRHNWRWCAFFESVYNCTHIDKYEVWRYCTQRIYRRQMMQPLRNAREETCQVSGNLFSATKALLKRLQSVWLEGSKIVRGRVTIPPTPQGVGGVPSLSPDPPRPPATPLRPPLSPTDSPELTAEWSPT